MEGIKIKEKEIFKIIYTMTQKHKEKLNIKWLCQISNVSRSGYYAYVSRLTSKEYLLREEKEGLKLERGQGGCPVRKPFPFFIHRSMTDDCSQLVEDHMTQMFDMCIL